MEFKLKPAQKDSLSILTKISVPCTPEMKSDIENLKRVYGKGVNEKLREMIQALIDKNNNEKAS